MTHHFPTRILFASALVVLTGGLVLADWPEWRGPEGDGRAPDRGVPESWSPAGENLAWRAPYGGRSGPVVYGDRLYLQTEVGSQDTAQERVVALDANTGKLVWERRFNVFHSDVPAHRAGWASPSVDPATGHIYAFSVNALLTAYAPDGKVVWERSLIEEYGFVTTHGGRTVSPLIEGDLVVVHGLNVGWGELGRGGNRWFAFDKRTGQTVWISSPQKRHYDTNMSFPIVAAINGMKQMIVGGTDGAYHSLEVNTGRPVWEYELSKRAILTSAVMHGTDAILTHSEENIGSNEMGMIAAVDATATGTLGAAHTRWFRRGFLAGFASPVIGGDVIYAVDNGAVLGAFDVKDGSPLWTKTLGTIQKASPVLVDGKLYIGTENGKVFILRPSRTGVEVLDEDWLGSERDPEVITGSPAVSGGRVFVTSHAATYAIGARAPAAKPAKPAAVRAETPSAEAPATLQVFPYEVALPPGGKARFTVRLFDAKGRFIREEPKVAWTLEGLGGRIDAGAYAAPADTRGEAGLVSATAAGVTGKARVRVLPRLPFAYDFEGWQGEAPPAHWLNTQNKIFVRDLDGGKVLVRVPDATPQRRTRVFVGDAALSNYTIQADVRVTERRRQMGDVGLINQRYALVLFGNSQKLELQPWQAAPGRTVLVKFAWKPDAWYRVKFRVEPQANGTTLARGKVWPRDEPEPDAWTVEKLDKLGHRLGAPGLYADPNNDIYFDNLKVTANQ
jgi:outer membrane protein assembly factor BamB